MCRHVQNLVGITDFTFHAVRASRDSSDSSLNQSDDEKDKETTD
jgi:hypothetical protein